MASSEDLLLLAVERMATKIDDIRDKTDETHIEVTKLAAQELGPRLKEVEKRVGKNENRVIAIETRTIVVASCIGVFIAGAGLAIKFLS